MLLWANSQRGWGRRWCGQGLGDWPKPKLMDAELWQRGARAFAQTPVNPTAAWGMGGPEMTSTEEALLPPVYQLSSFPAWTKYSLWLGSSPLSNLTSTLLSDSFPQTQTWLAHNLSIGVQDQFKPLAAAPKAFHCLVGPSIPLGPLPMGPPLTRSFSDTDSF